MLLVLRWVHEKIPTWPIPIAQGSPPTLAPIVEHLRLFKGG
jgi:hypothetical protein